MASVQSVIDGGGAVAQVVAPGTAGASGPTGPTGQAGGLAVAAAPATPEERQAVVSQAQGVKQAVEKLNSNLARLDDLLAKVQEGKSVTGKLLTDERMGRRVGDVVETAADYVDRLDRLQVEVALRSEWLLNQSGAKTYFGIKLLPRPDKYYMLEVVSDPRGVDTVTTETITERDRVTGQETSTVSTKTLHQQQLTFSLQIAKRYGPVTFRAGVIESSGGVGSDLHLLQDHLQLSVSVYQFSRPNPDVLPRAKVFFNYSFLQHFYVSAGADDFLNRWQTGRYPGGPKFSIGNDVFFGGGLFFTDDDLKLLMGTGAGSAVGTASSLK
jgi:phospholipid/cholesterol/gamma-HCH transport system substrate-binding protein